MYSHLRCYLLYVCFVFNGPSPASVRLFSFFSNTNLQKNYHFQRGSNFNSLNRRQAHWPNDHGQCLVFLFSCHISNLMAKKLGFLRKMGQSRPLFVYFCHFLDTISIIQIEKSVDGVLGTRTRGRRMVGADKTTELWRPPSKKKCYLVVP